ASDQNVSILGGVRVVDNFDRHREGVVNVDVVGHEIERAGDAQVVRSLETFRLNAYDLIPEDVAHCYFTQLVILKHSSIPSELLSGGSVLHAKPSVVDVRSGLSDLAPA